MSSRQPGGQWVCGQTACCRAAPSSSVRCRGRAGHPPGLPVLVSILALAGCQAAGRLWGVFPSRDKSALLLTLCLPFDPLPLPPAASAQGVRQPVCARTWRQLGSRGEWGCRAPRTPWLISGSQQSQDNRGPFLGQAQRGRAPGQSPNLPPIRDPRPPAAAHLSISRSKGPWGCRGHRHRGIGTQAGSPRTRVQVPAQSKLRKRAGVTRRGFSFPVYSGEASAQGRQTGPAPSAHRTVHPGACSPGNATRPWGGGFPCTCVSTYPWGRRVHLPLPELSTPPPLGTSARTLPRPSLRVPSWDSSYPEVPP